MNIYEVLNKLNINYDEVEHDEVFTVEDAQNLDIADKIAEKASKIYTKQIEKNKVLKYHCDYRKLEKIADEYVTANCTA